LPTTPRTWARSDIQPPADRGDADREYRVPVLPRCSHSDILDKEAQHLLKGDAPRRYVEPVQGSTLALSRPDVDVTAVAELRMPVPSEQLPRLILGREDVVRVAISLDLPLLGEVWIGPEAEVLARREVGRLLVEPDLLRLPR
jgi:hypothetical protein